MEDKYGLDHEEPKSKKFNGRNVADNIMKGVIVLIMAVIFVMIADQVITTPFISAEIEGEFFHGSIFGTTIIPSWPTSSESSSGPWWGMGFHRSCCA